MHRSIAITICGFLFAMSLGAIPIASAANKHGSTSLFAQLAKTHTPTDMKNAEIHFERDAARCTAYYSLNYTLAEKGEYANTHGVKGMKRASDYALKLTLIAAQDTGMSAAEIESQLKRDSNKIVKQLSKSYSKAPAVNENIGMPCKTLLEHPKDRLTYWLNADKKQATHTHKQ